MEDTNTIMIILQGLTTVLFGTVVFFLKNTLNEVKAGIFKNTVEIEQVQKELNELKSDMPFIYTTREDFIRVMNNVDNKLDKLLYKKE